MVWYLSTKLCWIKVKFYKLLHYINVNYIHDIVFKSKCSVIFFFIKVITNLHRLQTIPVTRGGKDDDIWKQKVKILYIKTMVYMDFAVSYAYYHAFYLARSCKAILSRCYLPSEIITQQKIRLKFIHINMFKWLNVICHKNSFSNIFYRYKNISKILNKSQFITGTWSINKTDHSNYMYNNLKKINILLQ